MDIFESRSAKPMLIAEMQAPFDSPDYIYELKLDGERCVAYLDKDSTTLLNKRDFILNPRFPELNEIHKSVKDRCILDGEIAILVDGKPDFSEVKRRSVLSNKFKVEMALNKHPASFTVFDILYYKDKQVTDMLLMERKELLSKVVKENNLLSVSRYIEEKGTALYEAAAQQELPFALGTKWGVWELSELAYTPFWGVWEFSGAGIAFFNVFGTFGAIASPFLFRLISEGVFGSGSSNKSYSYLNLSLSPLGIR